ncbi:putative disease resistance protein RGA1 [Salvia miltiorrhiza]|uniref:putative disease resistance protein RGA1 n=1 Tax=Salvia miltiorrhiza TaxID=226208 RepID=UPI0025ACB726|nr:putative disease resistance protein RGA1 [Salvia miltiorrhiza]XP_057781370.1 putative disease resistance protein RGA1 [Salvia miltiorrhiza]XP_057781371.1 putative disease resistance protein RGA1 [Salvia miltiorrhiza]XP_057781372.1 putative disease resistance protein RGA1 [Salvia miltiorrhiza]
MEGGAAAAVEVLVQNLIDLSKKEISQIRGLHKDAAKLAGSLDVIKNFLKDAETRDITSDAVKSWLKKLENEAFDADNVLDELNYHILSKKIKATKPMKAKVLSCFSSSFSSIARPRKMAVKIQEINENLESIKKEATELGLIAKLENEPILVNTAIFETDSFTDDPIFIGRDDVASKIVGMLMNGIKTDERAVSILPIVGMGGLGKTTLTRKVFNRLKNETQFGSYLWVHVSPNFDAITLFKKILNNLTSCQVEIASREDILAKLKEALKDKTYLLVLDDVWNQDGLKWEDFMNSFSGVSCVKGNAIVVTTRNMEVASIVNTLHIHELKGLSKEECWSIIRAKAFGKKDVPSEFEAIGRKIARRCQGLPLAANIVGAVLRNKSEEKWRSVEEKWLSADEGGDNITNILRLSFDNLSLPSLKKCFAYCAMFPKGSQISKRKLIEFWMAEGFLPADERDEMESVGEKFINVLLHNSLLQVSKRDRHGNVEECGMHDLVHDLACSVSSSSNSTGGSSRVRYMTLGDNYCGDESNRIPKEMAKSLRTLLITSKGDISDVNFSDLESLHVLKLHSEVKKLPSSIRKLIHLRDFDISKTSIEVLPDWIGEFFHLQTLRVESGWLRKLPCTIKYLINLRHLYIDWRVELPMGIGRLTSLQTLTHFPVGDENGCKIEELGSLNNLKGEVRIWKLERVHDKEEAGKANLFKKSKILKLCLMWGEDREGERNDEDVLEGLQPHSHLRELVIDEFNGKRFPLWTRKMAVRHMPGGSWVVLNNLLSLSLIRCREFEEIPMLGHLPNLKSLQLHELSNLKYINSSFYGMVNKDTRIVFPALEKFTLEDMPMLAEWAEIEISDGSEVKLFPRLKHLEINECEQLMSVPSLGQLPNLKSLVLIGLSNLKCINSSFYGMVNKDTRIVFPALERLELKDMPKLAEWAEIEIWDGSEVEVFPRLQHLQIIGCEQLMNVPSLGQLPNLKSLRLEALSNLKSINSLFYGMVNKDSRIVFPALEKPELRSMPMLAEWAEIEIWDGSEVEVFPRLQHLEIKNCERLMNVPSLGQLPNLKSLELRWLINVKCINSSFYGMVNKDTRIVFPALEELRLEYMPKLAEWAEIEISDGSEVKLFPRLQHLTIYKCEQLMSVPSHVSSCLEFLWIYKIGVECLPADWLLSNSETLSSLEIDNCPNLREISDRWGEEESEGRSFTITYLPKFPRLTFLGIHDCPQLKSVPSHVSSCLQHLSINGIGVECLPADWLLSNSETLSHLSIGWCPNLREISDRWGEEESEGRSFTITSLPKFPRLTYLFIRGVPNLSLETVDAMRRLQIDGIKYIEP